MVLAVQNLDTFNYLTNSLKVHIYIYISQFSLMTGFLERLALFSAISALLAAANCSLAYGVTAGGVSSRTTRWRGSGVTVSGLESCKTK